MVPDLLYTTAYVGLLVLLFRGATRLHPGHRVDAALACCVFVAAYLIFSFHVLAWCGVFTRTAGLLALGLPAGLVVRFARRVPSRPAGPLPRIDRRALWLAVPTAAVALIDTVGGLIAPPMAWDALTYHLPRAAMWVQSGSRDLPDFPGAWSYYQWFRTGGDVIWSWVLLPTGSDSLLALAGLLTLLVLSCLAFRVAQELGASDTAAFLAATSIASIPAVIRYTVAYYVDNGTTCAVLASVLFLLRYLKTGHFVDVAASATAGGVAAAFKTSALAPAAIVLVVLAVRLVTQSRIRWLVAAGALAALAGGGDYLYAALHNGSPLYPFRAPLLGSILPYHQGFVDLHSGGVDFGAPVGGREAIAALFYGHLNLGLGALLLLLCAPAGLAALWRRGNSVAILLIGCTAMAMVVGAAGPDSRAIWTHWPYVSPGRLLLPGLVPLLLASSALAGYRSVLIAGASVVLCWLYLRPASWPMAMMVMGCLVVLLLATVAAAPRLRKLAVRPTSAFALVAAFCVVLVALQSYRLRVREQIYPEMASQRWFVAHPLLNEFSAAAEVFQCLERSQPSTVTVITGEEGSGQHQFFYPLLGSSFSNRLYPAVPDLPADVGETEAPWLRAVRTDRIVGFLADDESREAVERSATWSIQRESPEGDSWLAARDGTPACGSSG